MSAPSVEVAIIGAGPNGLGLAAYLRERGVHHRVFGSPMQTWRDMPAGMYLKSLGFATSIPSPDGNHTFPEYCRARGLEDYEPIEFATFAQYGMDFQRDHVPHVENTMITDVVRDGSQFVLTLATGERVRANRVVVAVGLTYFARVPEVFAGLPSDRVAHTWGRKDFASYNDRDVIVIGGGSSALETATLLHEHGARVQVLARSDAHWGGSVPRDNERTVMERLKLPVTSLGHGRANWMLQHVPWLMHYVPSRKRIPFTRRHLGPGAAWWLQDRAVGKFPIITHASVLQASLADGRVRLRVREGGVAERTLDADQVILGTGYVFDVDRLPFINPDLARQIRRHDLAPRLSRRFESSVPGLYFIGPVAAESFGPLVRFVAGSPFAVGRVATALAPRARARRVSRGPSTAVVQPATASTGQGS